MTRGWRHGLAWLLAWAAWPHVLGAPDPMQEAQKLFAVGRPAEAAVVLAKVVKSGPVGADVWFNLGQAWSASGEPGRALWAWRQGLREAPRDPGLRRSVAQARQRAGGTGGHPLTQWLGWARPEEWAAGTVAASLALAGWWVVGWKWGGKWGGKGLRGLGWVAGLQVFLAAGWLGAVMGLRWSPDAVVVVREAPVALAPVPEAKTVRTLLEGSEVRGLRRHGDWTEVEWEGQRVGWVRTGHLLGDTP